MSGILSAICTNYAIASAFPSTVKVLVVGGGGGGGAGSGGGGGAGGLVYDSAYIISNNTRYTVTVGGGGAGGIAVYGHGGYGQNSVFHSLVAIGGGGGVNAGNDVAGSGGCGGGTGYPGTPGIGSQGGNGAEGSGGAPYNGGGGGGAGGNAYLQNGGVGIQYNISGTPTYYAGGGSGGPDNYRGGTFVAGALGGGGSGDGGNGTDGLGGGGAGHGNNPHGNGGNGGSGVVIISYVGDPIATGGTITSSGGNTIHTFTSSGNFIVGTPPQTYATWDSANKAASLTLSNGDLTSSDGSEGWSSCLGTLAKSSGKWYWEVECIAGQPDANHHYGVTKDTAYNSVNYIGQNANGYAYAAAGNLYHNNVVDATPASFNAGDVIGIALDLDGGTLDFYKNNTHQGTQYTGLSGTFYPAFSTENTNDSLTANFGASAFYYTPPTGFNAGLYA